MRIVLSPFILMFFLPLLAEARTLHVAPLNSSFMVGGYDTSTATKAYCKQAGFHFQADLQGTSLAEKNRSHGAFGTLAIALRNISATPQTVDVYFESVTFSAFQWTVSGEGLRDSEFKQTMSNNGAGYKRTYTIGPYKSLLATFQYGCQGNSIANNCWLWAFPVKMDGVQVQTHASLFGVLPLADIPKTQAWQTNLCYRLATVFSLRFEVRESKGSVVGSVATQLVGGGMENILEKKIDIELNGGLPF